MSTLSGLPTDTSPAARRPIHSRSRRLATVLGTALVLGGSLVACSSGSTSGTAAPAPAGGSAAVTSAAGGGAAGNVTGGNGGTNGGGTNGGGNAAGGGQGAARPGASGLIADVDAASKSMDVQSRTNQVTVNWTGTTTFSVTAAATAADVQVGACVLADSAPATTGAASSAGAGQGGTGAAPTGAAGGSAPAGGGSGSAGGGFDQKVTELTATTVTVSAAVNGKCTDTVGGGMRGSGGTGATPPTGGSGGQGGAAPTGAPSGAANGNGAANGGGRGNGGYAGAFGRRVSGTVTKVSGATITLSATDRADSSTYTSTVTTQSATTYLKESKGTAASLKTGLCATAVGKADTTGAVAATAIAITPATNGTCTTGFGGGRARGGNGGNGNGGNGNGGVATTTSPANG